LLPGDCDSRKSRLLNLLHDLLDSTAKRAPDSQAIRFRGTGLSYAALRQRSLDVAASLAALGVRRGDRIAICMQNRPEVVELALAASRLGAIFVPVSPILKVRQLEHLLKDSGATVLAASQGATHALDELLRACPTVKTLVLCDATRRPSLPPDIRAVRYEELAAGSSPELAASGAIADDAAALLYTSGSTGRPKGVIVSHRNFVSGAASVSQYQRNTAGDRILAALPLSFDYGFSQVTVAFAVGACAVLANFALPAALLQEAQTERITGLAGVPTMWMHLAAMEWPPAVARSLRYVTNSGGAMPAAVLARLRAALPTTQVYCMYGLTEAFRSTYLDPAELDRRPGSIGKAIPGQEVFVLRPDGSECAAGEVGELVHRGSLVTLGYWNDPDKTARRFRPLPPKLPQIPRSEWAVWSGDLVRTDAEGFLYFVSRGDHLIKSSGYRISPTEVEEAVAEVPGVVESAAVGLADESLGQRVAVAIVAAAGSAAGELAEAVRQHCRVQLPSYMVPAEIHVLDSLPRNANGKCDRGVLAVQLADLAPRAREA
jgi:acyl-CoA ligase (AMP-forming) (exosortase A-associated)